MNKVINFENLELGAKIRVVENGQGEPLWVAKDVAEALGYTWKGSSGTISHVPEEWRGIWTVQIPLGSQEMSVLTEQGLYFFLGRSDKPTALPFQKWIAGEVLPSIRKTGKYAGLQRITGWNVADRRLTDLIIPEIVYLEAQLSQN